MNEQATKVTSVNLFPKGHLNPLFDLLLTRLRCHLQERQ